MNIPPLNGPNAGTAGYVEVIITKQRTNYLTRLLGQDTTDIQARAVGAPAGSGESCVLALDHDMDAAIEVEGTADTHVSCGVAANSRSAKAFEMIGTANLSADIIQAHGDITIGTNSTLNVDLPPKPYSRRVDDPYDDLALPDKSVCPDHPVGLPPGAGLPPLVSASVTLSPGCYTDGLQISGNSTVVTFNPGLYIIDGGDMIIDGGATTFGVGVTFVLTGNAAADIGNLRIAGGTTNTLTAPSAVDDDYAGVLFYQDRRAISFSEVKVKGKWTEVINNNEILGGASTDLEGAIYFPSQGIRYGGGAGVGDGCTQIIGLKVTFAGNSNVLNDPDACAALRVRTIGNRRVALLE